MQSTVLTHSRDRTGFIGTKICGFVLLFIVLNCVSEKCHAQEPDYEIIFGKDWEKAILFLNDSKSWIEPVLAKNNIPYSLAMAIVFPELVRYSALRDKMEVSMLKILYVNLGEDYADFSIGPFQMKPSFAESVRKESSTVNHRKIKKAFKQEDSYKDGRDYRSDIIQDLQDPQKQLNYLISFIKICEKKFNGRWDDERSQVEFFSTVYNSGLNLTAEKIGQMRNLRYFNIKLTGGDYYSYSDVSLYWYDKIKGSVASSKK